MSPSECMIRRFQVSAHVHARRVFPASEVRSVRAHAPAFAAWRNRYMLLTFNVVASLVDVHL